MRKRKILMIALVVSLMAISGLDAQMNSALEQADRASSLLDQAKAALGVDRVAVKNFSYNGKVRRVLPGEEAKEILANAKARFSLTEKSFIFSEQVGDEADTHVFIRREGDGPVAFKHAPGGEEKVMVFKKGGNEDVIILKGGGSEEKVVEKVIEGGAQIKMRRTHVTADGKVVTIEGAPLETKERVMLHHPQADFARRVLGMILQTPTDFPVQYTYAGGVETADGNADVLDVTGPEGFRAKLYLNSVTHLPVMLSYTGVEPVVFLFKKAARPEEAAKMMAERPVPKEALIEVRFSDHRNVDGLMLPYRITKSVNGQLREEVTVESYELNSTAEWTRQ